MSELADWQQRLETSLRNRGGVLDGAHDLGHFRRVWLHADNIADRMHGDVDKLVLLAAAYLHDIVSLRKEHPGRAESSRLAAKEARAVLTELRFPEEKLDAVEHAIEAHSHSAKIPAKTVEAKILQDADRLESLGAIGVARLFFIAGQKNGHLFHGMDPKGERRSLDEDRYALDHYYEKLRHTSERMNTDHGRVMARARAEFLLKLLLANC
jgi:uncharacterized protein